MICGPEMLIIVRTLTTGLNKQQVDRSTPGLKILESPDCGDSVALQSHSVLAFHSILCTSSLSVPPRLGLGLRGTGVTEKALSVGGVGAAHREARKG